MNEKKVIENIYRMLDGELSVSEQEEMERYLAQHSEAQLLYNQCEKIKDQFEASRKAEVEPDFKAEILRKIDWEQYKQQDIKMETKFIHNFWQRPAFRVSFVFIAGVFVGFLLFSFLKSDFTFNEKKTEKMKGTFYGSNSYEDLKVADMLTYESVEAKAVCSARYSADLVEIHLELSSSQEVKSVVEFDQHNFAVLNIRNENVNERSTALIAVNKVLINNTGDNKYIIQLANRNNLSHDIAFKILQNDQAVYQNSIKINNK